MIKYADLTDGMECYCVLDWSDAEGDGDNNFRCFPLKGTIRKFPGVRNFAVDLDALSDGTHILFSPMILSPFRDEGLALYPDFDSAWRAAMNNLKKQKNFFQTQIDGVTQRIDNLVRLRFQIRGEECQNDQEQ